MSVITESLHSKYLYQNQTDETALKAPIKWCTTQISNLKTLKNDSLIQIAKKVALAVVAILLFLPAAALKLMSNIWESYFGIKKISLTPPASDKENLISKELSEPIVEPLISPASESEQSQLTTNSITTNPTYSEPSIYKTANCSPTINHSLLTPSASTSSLRTAEPIVRPIVSLSSERSQSSVNPIRTNPTCSESSLYKTARYSPTINHSLLTPSASTSPLRTAEPIVRPIVSLSSERSQSSVNPIRTNPTCSESSLYKTARYSPTINHSLLTPSTSTSPLRTAEPVVRPIASLSSQQSQLSVNSIRANPTRSESTSSRTVRASFLLDKVNPSFENTVKKSREEFRFNTPEDLLAEAIQHFEIPAIKVRTAPRMTHLNTLGRYATDQDLIAGLLKDRSGFALGEIHTHTSPKRFLIDNMEYLKKQGVTTIFIEGIYYYEEQHLLDLYLSNNYLLSPSYNDVMTLIRKIQSLIGPRNPMYRDFAVIEAAKRHGIRVVGMDYNMRKLDDPCLNKPNRRAQMNYMSWKVIEHETNKLSPGEKYVAFMGKGHLCKLVSSSEVPGLADLLEIPTVYVRDNAYSFHERSVTYNSEDIIEDPTYKPLTPLAVGIFAQPN